MKSLSILESSIIGFFVGVIVSTYVLFIDSIGGYVGSILNYISLRPALSHLQFPGDTLLATHFLFIVIVFIVYAIVIGMLLKNNRKSIFYIVPLVILVIVGIFYQQIQGLHLKSSDQTSDISTAIYINTETNHNVKSAKKAEQYFGTEAVGDLNGDGLDDVAFIVSRTDPDRGILNYLVGSLATKDGHTGTNLLFMGDKVKPQSISIKGGIIDVTYIDGSKLEKNTTKHFYAHVSDQTLQQVIIEGKGNTLFFGNISLEGDTVTFLPCNLENTLVVHTASTSLIRDIQSQIIHISSQNGNSLPIFGIVIGSSTVDLTQNSSTTSKITPFDLQELVTLLPKGVCL